MASDLDHTTARQSTASTASTVSSPAPAPAPASHGPSASLLKYVPTIQESASTDASKTHENLHDFLKQLKLSNAKDAAGSAGAAVSDMESGSILAFLDSKEGDIVAPAAEHDLSHPMSHYFISSSHNTYLTGNQLYSNSSVDGYMKALKVGCRCVEIDVWDGKAFEQEKVEEEIAHIEERISHMSDPVGAADHGGSHSGLREKLGFHKHHEGSPGIISAAAEKARERTKKKPESSPMPTRWKGSSEPEPEPRVLHGYTLTKEIPFRYVCKAIAASAFISSDLPIIVSLEVHCNLEQQEKMVEIMRDVWRDYLLDVTRYATGNEPEYTAPLPSPEALTNKILIKVKYTPPEVAEQKHTGKGEKDDSASSDEEEENAGDQLQQKKSQKKKKILDDLSLLGVYTRSFHFKSFSQKEAQLSTHVFALSENKIKEAIEDHSVELAHHNKKYFMRAYPKGVRVSSSNLNPIRMWRHGVQMVALNWQSCDKSIMLNHGMFSGTKGWVLKPRSYWDPTMIPPADANTIVPPTPAPMTEKHAEPSIIPEGGQLSSSDNPPHGSTHDVDRDPQSALQDPQSQASLSTTSESSTLVPSVPQASKSSISSTPPESSLSNIPTTTSTQTNSSSISIPPSLTHVLSSPRYALPKHLNLSMTFYAGDNLPLPAGTSAKHFKPYIKIILHTEAVPNQHASRSHSHSRSSSPHFQSGRHIGNAKESASTARARATSLLQNYKDRHSTHPADAYPGSSENGSSDRPTRHDNVPASIKAKPRYKLRTVAQRGADADFHAETVRFEDVKVDTEAEYMTFVRIKLMHEASMHKDELAGWSCVRLGRLRKGWGILKLRGVDGEATDGRLLVRVTWSVWE